MFSSLYVGILSLFYDVIDANTSYAEFVPMKRAGVQERLQMALLDFPLTKLPI